MLIGDQEVERVERSETVVGGRASVTTMRRREIRRVISASEIATRLGPRQDGIKVLLLGLSDDVLELTVPYVSPCQRRPPHVPAAWFATPTQRASAVPAKRPPIAGLSKDVVRRIREMRE